MQMVVIGASGQLGTDLMRVLPTAIPVTHADLELTDAEQVARRLDELRPDLVLNTAAYNLVDKAETEPEKAYAINAEAPAILAQWCQRNQATLLHVSTDYVFGGETGRRSPYLESDTPAPLGVYGSSKLAGENHVREICDRHFVIRTCGLYGQAATRSKGNFVKTILRLADERPELRVVNDQFCTPTYTFDVAQGIAALIRTQEFGTYHLTNHGATTWFEVAREAVKQSGRTTVVHPIPSSEYPTPAKRPAYSVLDCTKIQSVTGQIIPHWQDALNRYLRELSDPASRVR